MFFQSESPEAFLSGSNSVILKLTILFFFVLVAIFIFKAIQLKNGLINYAKDNSLFLTTILSTLLSIITMVSSSNLKLSDFMDFRYGLSFFIALHPITCLLIYLPIKYGYNLEKDLGIKKYYQILCLTFPAAISGFCLGMKLINDVLIYIITC